MRSNKLSLLLVASLATAISCGPSDPEQSNQQDECPAERSYRCGDDSCVADGARCPGDEEDPEEISGQILSVSPGTIRGDSPEQVKLSLQVQDSVAIKEMLEKGGAFAVVLRDSTGEEEISVDEVVAPDGDEEGVFELSFTPGEEERRSIRKQVRVQLAADGDNGKVYAWGDGRDTIAFPDDVGDLDFEERQARALEGLGEFEAAWSPDLDGDGVEDLVVLDNDGETRRLVVIRCADGKCSDAGEVALAADGDIGGPYEEIFEVPDLDLMAGPDGGGEGGAQPFVIAYPSLRDDDGNLREIEHLVVRLAEGDDGMEVVEERTVMAVPRMDGRTWLANTIKPRLIVDQDGQEQAGISIFARDESSGTVALNHVLLQEAVEPMSQALYMGIEDLDQDGLEAALRGDISSAPRDEFYQQDASLPEGRFVSVFEIDGDPMAVIGSSTSGDQMVQAQRLADGGGTNLSLLKGSTIAQTIHFDDDEDLDVVFSVATEQGHALMVSLADASSPQLAMEAPQLVMDGLASGDWKISRDGEELRLKMSRHHGNPDTGGQPESTHEIGLEVEVDDEGKVHVQPVNEAPVTTGIPVHGGDSSSSSSIMRTSAGHELVRIENTGREAFADGIRSTDVGGLFLGSEQLISSGGMWVGAHFSGGIVEGDETSLLQPGDPESIIGWLSSTGPFLPVTSVCCDAATPIIIQELATAPIEDEDSDDDGVEAQVVSLVVDDNGDATGLRLEDLAMIDGEPRLAGERDMALDFSAAELSSRNVVKFKAGAELSKTASVASDTDDCDDSDDDVRRDSCPGPSSTTLLFVMDSGELAKCVIDGDSERCTLAAVETAHEELDDELFFDSIGSTPVLATRAGPPLLAVDVWEAATELSQTDGGDKSVSVTRDQGRIFFGDFQGLGHPQIMEARLGDDGEVCGQTSHLAVAGGEGQGDLESIEAALDREGQSVCMPVDEAISIADLDGDRCEDLVFPESRQALLSRCDGTFEPELTELGDWSGHLGGDDGWNTRAKDHNSSRSNKPRSIRDLGGDLDDDDDGVDDEVIVVFPFIDGLERR